MSGLLDLNLAEAQDMITLPNDTEVELRVSNAEEVPVKADPSRNNLALTFDVPSDPTVKDIKMWLPIPTAALREEDPKKWNSQLLRIKAVYEGLGMDINRLVSAQEMIGETGYAIIGESDDPNFGMQNYIRSWIKRR